MISTENERVFIRHLSDLSGDSIYTAELRRPAALASYVLFVIQLLRHPSEHGTGSMGRHLLANAKISMLNKFTESEVTELTSSMVDDTALAILNRQGSRGITIVSSQRKFRFDINVDPYWEKWQTKRSKQAAKDFETSKFHRDTWNHYLMLGTVSAHIPWNAIPNLELQRSYKALCDDSVLPSFTTLSNICWRAYALTMDAIKKQVPSGNTVSLALDGWTSTNKLAITSLIAHYMEQYWPLSEVQHVFDEVDHLFFRHFES